MSYEGLVIVNYQLVRKLGEGGFGLVFLAEQKQLDRKAAIKILHPIRDALDPQHTDPACGARTTPPPQRDPDQVESERFAPTVLRSRDARGRPGQKWLWAVATAALFMLVATAKVATGKHADASTPTQLELERISAPAGKTISHIEIAAPESSIALVTSTVPERKSRAAAKPGSKTNAAPKPGREPKPTSSPASLDCSVSSFARVGRATSPSEGSVHAALRRLRQCRGRLETRQYATIQSLLVSKL